MLLSAGLGLAGGALAARLAELQGFLVPVSAGFLGVGSYVAYGRKLATRPQRIMLLLATPLTVFFWILPYIAR